MGSESIYTDNQITKVAEKVAGYILNVSGDLEELLLMGKQWREGPLTMFAMWSHKYNPLGGFGIELEALTMAQKRIIVRIVGNAMAKKNRL